MMKIGIVCYPTYGGSGVVATELGLGLAKKGHKVHFITYRRPARLTHFHENVFYHEVSGEDYPLFEYPPYDTALASKLVDVVKFEQLDLLHVHYAIPHATVAYMAKKILLRRNRLPAFDRNTTRIAITIPPRTPKDRDSNSAKHNKTKAIKCLLSVLNTKAVK